MCGMLDDQRHLFEVPDDRGLQPGQSGAPSCAQSARPARPPLPATRPRRFEVGQCTNFTLVPMAIADFDRLLNALIRALEG
jgi:hypothetical protein